MTAFFKQLKRLFRPFFSGPQWRKSPPYLQVTEKHGRYKSLLVCLWYWINSLLDLIITRPARLFFLIWLPLTFYTLSMLPDSPPAIWLFISAAALVDLLTKLVFRQKLTIRRTLPHRVRCGIPFCVHYHITNHSSLPCYALQPDAYTLCDSPGTVILQKDCNISADIPRKSSAEHELHCLALTRGQIRCTRPVAETAYPFHAFKRSFHYGKRESIMVLPYSRTMPEIVPLFEKDLAAISSPSSGENTHARSGNDNGDNFYACRDYRYGDQPKRIHWRISAQRSKLTVREYEKESSGKAFILLLDPGEDLPEINTLALMKKMLVTPEKKDDVFEGAVSMCASVLQTLEEHGVETELLLPGNDDLTGDDAMDALAVLQQGITPDEALSMLLQEEKREKVVSIFPIVMQYDETIRSFRKKLEEQGIRCGIHFILIGTAEKPGEDLDADILYRSTKNILPEVLL